MIPIEERSFLSQSIYRINVTEDYLRNCQKNVALPYVNKTNEVLQVNVLIFYTMLKLPTN